MIRIIEGNEVFSEKRISSCDCSRSDPMPQTDKITELLTRAPIFELPYHISTMGHICPFYYLNSSLNSKTEKCSEIFNELNIQFQYSTLKLKKRNITEMYVCEE